MTILITGAHGFVGKHVVDFLQHGDEHILTPSHQELNLIHTREDLDRGYRMHESAHALAGYCTENNVSSIVHLAATCGGIGINKDNPGKFIYENLQMGISVLEGARLSNVMKIVNLSTVCSYPKFTPVPFQEEDIWNGYPEETNASYGIAKKTIMEMGIAYSRQYGMDITNLVPCNMAGEYDNFDEYASHVIPALIKKFEQAQKEPQVGVITVAPDGSSKKQKYGVVELWGTGSASREFLDAKDCARAIQIALQRKTGPQPINLGTGREITIQELATLVKKIGGYDAEIIWDNTKPDGQPRRSLDVTRARNVLRWEARIPLEETIRRTIEWYRENV